jgi:uncharacterized membrane protein YeaQ/YmgE (transglycosylase-associated protein family)
MDITNLLVFLAIGGIAGWLARLLLKGGGYGLLVNIVIGVIGVIGSVVGGFAFGLLGLSASGLLGSIITATVGAVLLLLIVGLLKRAAEPPPLIAFPIFLQRKG